jgi:predicted TPR repeat methyltransferase
MSHFDKRADGWDKGDAQVNGAKIIANAIRNRVALTPQMEVMDFGTGTGLLGFDIATSVKKVYGVDTSKEMLKKLQEKNTPKLSIDVCRQDIVKEPIERIFDGLVSSMTLHHIENLRDFFTAIHKNLKEKGFIAIADLRSEDGTFHSDNAGVFHFGFEEKELRVALEECGFDNVSYETINVIKKPHREFGVFLLTANKK